MAQQIEAAYRAAVERALSGRTASRTAVSHGLPKDAILTVLRGHDPKLARAHDICRALGITFTLGVGCEDGAESAERRSDSRRTDSQPVRDIQLAELLSRLAARWDTIPGHDRAGLGLVMNALLDYCGAEGIVALGRAVDSLVWREFDDSGASHVPDSQD